MSFIAKSREKIDLGERDELYRQIDMITDELDQAVHEARLALDRFRACLFKSYTSGGRTRVSSNQSRSSGS